MDSKVVVDGLIMYLSLVGLLTFHEFGHAWMAWRCGDETPKEQGRVSLNPLVHIELFGTVVVPLFLLLSNSGFLVGWARPVQVNVHNLRNGKVDDILVTMAGPWMNLLLGAILMALARAGGLAGSENWTDFCVKTARLSLFLFYLNLLPVPPLDGSQILRAALGITMEAYRKMVLFGAFALFVVLQMAPVQRALENWTMGSMRILAGWFGVPHV